MVSWHLRFLPSSGGDDGRTHAKVTVSTALELKPAPTRINTDQQFTDPAPLLPRKLLSSSVPVASTDLSSPALSRAEEPGEWKNGRTHGF